MDEPRYLLRSGRTTDRPEDSDKARGYTDRQFLALDREPEPIDEESQRKISVEARTRFAETRSEELARKDSKRWCNRLRAAEMRAYSKRVDVYRYQLEVRQAIVAMEQATE